MSKFISLASFYGSQQVKSVTSYHGKTSLPSQKWKKKVSIFSNFVETYSKTIKPIEYDEYMDPAILTISKHV